MDVQLDLVGNTLAGDIELSGAELRADDGLKTAVVISLFTDRRALTDDALPAGVNADDRRGWWADALAGEEGDRIGSRLWLLAREKITTETLRRAEEYAAEALAWLIEDGIAAAVAVTAEHAGNGVLAIGVRISRPKGEIVNYRFNGLWEGVNDAV